MYTRPLAELRRTDAGEFGGKSANLGELLSAGLAVPAGFAIAASAFRTAGMPDDVRAEIHGRYEELGSPPVAVRSSAVGEDTEDASHAGQHDSFLWVRGAEQVCDAVRDCWASLRAPHAIAYRAARTGEAEPAMGVTVQRMVDAEVSGVMFTCNPVSGDPSMVAINASWGLGIAVVGGELTPDDYLVSKITGEVVRQTVNTKHIEYVQGAAGAERVEVSADRRDEPCLSELQLAALVDIARRVERHFGGHQDIEWALAGEAVHVLQARPVTTAVKPAPGLPASALSLVMSTFGAQKRP